MTVQLRRLAAGLFAGALAVGPVAALAQTATGNSPTTTERPAATPSPGTGMSSGTGMQSGTGMSAGSRRTAGTGMSHRRHTRSRHHKAAGTSSGGG